MGWFVNNEVAFDGPRSDQLLALAFEFIHGGFFGDLVILAEFELVPEPLALLRQRRFHLVGVCG